MSWEAGAKSVSVQVAFEGTVATIGATLDNSTPVLVASEIGQYNMDGPDVYAMVNNCLYLANIKPAEISSTG